MNLVNKIRNFLNGIHKNQLEYKRIKVLLSKSPTLIGNYFIFYSDKLYLFDKVRYKDTINFFKIDNISDLFLIIKLTLTNLIMFAKGLTLIKQTNQTVRNRKIIIKRESENLLLLDFINNKVFYRYPNPKEKLSVVDIYKKFYKTSINQITIDGYLEADLISSFDMLEYREEDYVIDYILQSQYEIFIMQVKEIKMKSLYDFNLSPIEYKYLENMFSLLKINKDQSMNFRIPFAKQHGDFVYHNFYNTENGLGLFDYEYAGEFPAFYDLVHFVIYPLWFSRIEQRSNKFVMFDILERFRNKLSKELNDRLPSNYMIVVYTILFRRILLNEITETSYSDLLINDSYFLLTLI